MKVPNEKGNPVICGQCRTRFMPNPKTVNPKYCTSRCFQQWRKSPEQMAARFWEKVDRRGIDQCWPYTGSITTHGYGCAQWGGRVLGTHKISYLLVKGPVPDGLQVMHACDNRICCNPRHLSLGTKADNAQDMVRKGRGRKDGGYKITAAQASAIKAARGKATSGQLAREYGLSQSYIFHIWGGKSWRNA